MRRWPMAEGDPRIERVSVDNPGQELWRRYAASCLALGLFAPPAAAQPRADLVERGRYLVESIGVCGHCHTPQQLKDGRQVDLPSMHLAGGYGFDNPVLGRWVGANITSDPETGIGSWTEVQIVPPFARGGDRMAPSSPAHAFAHYRKISDADAASHGGLPEIRAARAQRCGALVLPHPPSRRLGPARLRRGGPARATRWRVVPILSKSATVWIATRRTARAVAGGTGRAPAPAAGP